MISVELAQSEHLWLIYLMILSEASRLLFLASIFGWCLQSTFEHNLPSTQIDIDYIYECHQVIPRRSFLRLNAPPIAELIVVVVYVF